MILALMQDVPGRSRFAVGGYRDVLELPWGLRDAMLEQLAVWRSQEKSASK